MNPSAGGTVLLRHALLPATCFTGYAARMSNQPLPIILGSRSPQRRELLEKMFPQARLQIQVPADAREAGFDGLHGWPEIERRLVEIASHKSHQVRLSVSDESLSQAVIITADTVILGEDEVGGWDVLGQPPAENWQATVRDWFQRYYLGKTHRAATAVCCSWHGQEPLTRVVVSEVDFWPASPEQVEWYLSNGEPVGKAGGYAIQGAGGLFVSAVRGSLSNIVGLPLETVWEMLRELHVDVGH